MAVDLNLDSHVHIDKDQTVFNILARRGGGGLRFFLT